MRKRNKCITALLAAFMILAAFLMPMTAYANEIPDDPETIYGEDDPTAVPDVEELDRMDLIKLLELFAAFGMSDFEDCEESAIPDDSKAFTPDGQASVVDLAYEGDGKMFYTFKTPAGNVFYLVIDRLRATDNVYFLNAVTESDLLALAEGAGKTPESAIPTNPPNTAANGNGTGDTPDDPNGNGDTPPPAKKSNMGMIIFLVIGMAAVGGAGYYIKIVRPKRNADMDDEDDDIPDEDDGEEMEFEDEADEGGEKYEDTADSDGGESDEDRE